MNREQKAIELTRTQLVPELRNYMVANPKGCADELRVRSINSSRGNKIATWKSECADARGCPGIVNEEDLRPMEVQIL